VLDLDESLVRSFDDDSSIKKLGILKDPKLMDIRDRSYIISMIDVVNQRGMGNKSSLWGVTRPYINEFLHFCREYFDSVCVWSAGKHEYVTAICNEIFIDFDPPNIVYTFDHCEERNKHLIKPLRKLHDSRFNESNTFMLDDRHTVFLDNPNNGVLIPPYEPAENIPSLRKDDQRLLQFMEWLQKPEVVTAKDVRELDKSKIFR
jgi:hypothetical protein